MVNAQGIPKGYKKTEVGVIPENWECVQLGDVAIRVGSGITPTGGERVYTSEGKPFVRSQNVGWGRLELDDLVFIPEKIHATFIGSEIKRGDVLLNITGASIGRSAVADERIVGGNVNQHVCEIRPDKTKLEPLFLSSFLLSQIGQQQIDSFQAGGNRQGLNYKQIRSFLIPLPPLPEQRAIAAALSDVDGLLAALDALIAKKRAVKTAAMQQLLTGKTRLPGFGGEWAEVKLGDICKIRKGVQMNRDTLSSSGLYPVWNGGTEPSGYTENWNTEANTITISEGGNSCGFVNFIREKFWLGGHCYAITPTTVEKSFMYQLLKFQEPALMALRVGSGLPNIQRKRLERYSVTLPISPTEQRAIAAVLSDMDTEIAALEARREKVRQIKQGMMQVLLTGKVRLVSDDHNQLDKSVG